jgi:quercetin dioxygenase-like cupin family protein
MAPTTVRTAEVDPIEMVPGVWRRTLATGERMMMVHIRLAEGAAVPTHSHPHEQVGYVIEGRIRLTTAGRDADFEPGDSYFIPGDVEHAATAITDCILLEMFSPPRDEYRTPTT